MFFLESDYTTLTESIEPTNMGLEGLEGALIAVSETDESYFNLREKMMRLEHQAIVTEDMDLLQEGKKSFAINLKSIFGKLKSMIQEIYQRFVDWLTRTFGTDKQVVERFKEGQRAGRLAQSVEIQGFDYANLKEFGNKLTSIASTATSGKLSFGGEKSSESELYEGLAGDFGIKDTVQGKSDFVASVKKHLQGGNEKTKVTLTSASVLAILEGFKEEMASAKKAKDALQRSFDNMEKAMEKSTFKGDYSAKGQDASGVNRYDSVGSEDDFKNADPKSTAANSAKAMRDAHNKDVAPNIMSNMRGVASALSTAYGAYISALQGRRNQARAAVGRLVGAKNEADKKAKKAEKNAKNESFFGILGEF